MRLLPPIVLLLPLALLIAACGGGEKDAQSAAAPVPASEPVEGSVPPEPSPPETTEQVTTPERPEGLRVSPAGWATDFTRHTVPLNEFFGGGPGKDGIPAIDEPRFVSVGEADDWLEAREPVIAVASDGAARAYPIQILMWHEIVNDELAGMPITVTFCPLCNTALVFDRRLDDRVLDFGTTGNLRNSDLVMYDRQTESWWQQFGGEAVVGELAGAQLTQVPAAILSWEQFQEEHPDALVLSRETGHQRPYGANPYTGYDDVDQPPFFPVANDDDTRLPPKERVVFIEREDEAIAVPFAVVAELGTVGVTVGGEELQIAWREGTRSSLDSSRIAEGRTVGSVEILSVDSGERVVADTPFWFAVAAFRPDVRIVEPGGDG